MLFNLRARLTLSFLIVTLVSILLISVLANFFLESQFRQYIKINLERQNKQIIDEISRQYRLKGWNKTDITEIGMNALTQGLIVKLEALDGTVIWDATEHNNGLCQQMITHMAQNMLSRYPNWKGSYVENKYPIIKNSKIIGTIKIGYYGPFYFKDADLAFINTLNRILLGVTLLAIFLAFLIGSYTAKRLSMPIAKVINTAYEISTGNLDARRVEKTKIKEINQLTEAINHLAESLKQQETLRKRLTADVAHELRTPLTTLQSHMEAMLDGIWDMDQARLKVCYSEIMRVNRMVKDLEKLAKYESEDLNLETTNFNLKELIQQIIISFESEFYQKKVTIYFSGTDTQIKADQDKISQVIVNLLSNSLKYTPANGRVEIGLSENKDEIEMIVSDTGSGIPAEDLPYIFERFYRVDKSRNRISGGSGIGLAIVRSIIEAHHGTIQVESELGIGTRFIIKLPKNVD